MLSGSEIRYAGEKRKRNRTTSPNFCVLSKNSRGSRCISLALPSKERVWCWGGLLPLWSPDGPEADRAVVDVVCAGGLHISSAPSSSSHGLQPSFLPPMHAASS